MFTVGIDLGTTASVIAFMKNGVPIAVEADNGKVAVPSVVNYSDCIPIVGREAIYKADSANTVFSIKRFMGSEMKIIGRNAAEISADILSYLKETVEQKVGCKIDAAVITVPAHFSELQRIATKQAASIAGIKVLRLINEPTAAAVAFGLDKKTNGIFAVYDLGGGTFDFSVLRLLDGVFQVLSTGGDNYLGGDDIDIAILNYNFQLYGLDINCANENEKNLGKLVAKSLKERLMDNKEVYKTYNYKNNKYEFKLSYEVLKNISDVFLKKTSDIATQVFLSSNISLEKLDGVILVGGMTKLKLIKEMVAKCFDTKVFDDINPEEVVALGAAIQADSIANKNSVLLIDVVPLTLGVETLGGGVDKIIYRNTPIPIVEKREYTTYQNNQTGIQFRIVQGERPIAKECRSLADFELQNIPPMPAGMPRVVVEFSVDVNGLLSVKAYEKNTGISQSVIVEPASGLSAEEMTFILEKAFANRKKDSLEERNITIRIESERMIKFWESIISQIPEDERKNVFQLLDKLKKALNEEKYQEAIFFKKNIENIFGQFLDEIINNHLSGKSLESIER